MQIPDTTPSIFAASQGEAAFGDSPTPKKVYDHVRTHSQRPWALLEVDTVDFCPTDTHVVHGDFPGYDDQPYGPEFVVGHEVVAKVVDFDERFETSFLDAGIDVGTYVAVDCNCGCGVCAECTRGKPAIDCDNKIMWIGLNNYYPETRKWLSAEAGVERIAGAYAKYQVAPLDALHSLLPSQTESDAAKALAGQYDIAGCAYAALELAGLMPIPADNKWTQNIAIFGAGGRFGNWLVRTLVYDVMSDFLERDLQINIIAIDRDEDSLARIAQEANVYPTVKVITYAPDASETDPLGEPMREALRPHIGGERIDVALDTVGVLKPKQDPSHSDFELERFMANHLANNGRLINTAFNLLGHVNMATVSRANQMVTMALTPRNYIPRAMRLLSQLTHLESTCIPLGPLSDEVAHHVTTGGRDFDRAEGSTFFTKIAD